MFIYNSTPKQRKPKLTVDEDFDLVNPWLDETGRDVEADRACADLTAANFEPSTMKVGTRAQRAFVEHHHVTAVVAIRELRLLANVAIQGGKYRRASSGFHRLEYDNAAIWVTPDGQMAVHYMTRHFERMPSDLVAGRKSRYGKGRSRPLVERGSALSLDELKECFDPLTTPVTQRAINAFRRRGTLEKDAPFTDAILRSALRAAVEGGTWSHGKRPNLFVLADERWAWIIAADGMVITVLNPDELATEPRVRP